MLLTQGTASNVDQEQQQMVAQLQQQNQLMSQQLAQLQAQSCTSQQALADLQGQHQAALSGLSDLQAQHSRLSSQHAELQTQHETLDKALAKRVADHESANGSLQTQYAALMTQSTEVQRQHAETVSSLNMLKGDHEALTRQHAGLQVCLMGPGIACSTSLVVTDNVHTRHDWRSVCATHIWQSPLDGMNDTCWLHDSTAILECQYMPTCIACNHILDPCQICLRENSKCAFMPQGSNIHTKHATFVMFPV